MMIKITAMAYSMLFMILLVYYLYKKNNYFLSGYRSVILFKGFNSFAL